MKLIAGLGNPGRSYAGTRHNVGFMVADLLAEQTQARFRSKGEYECAELMLQQEKVLLIKPTTYMNLSGIAVRQALQYYKISPDDLLVICDDAALPMGKIRIRKEGSDGGQKGLRSIIFELNSDRFARLRIGIGRHENMDLADYVLSPFTEEEKPWLKQILLTTVQAVNDYIQHGIAYVMNAYNGMEIPQPTDEKSK